MNNSLVPVWFIAFQLTRNAQGCSHHERNQNTKHLARETKKSLNHTEFSAHFEKILDSVIDDSEEVVITCAGHEPAVIISLAEYESLKETAYLLKSLTNARRLLDSIEELENGGGVQHELLED